MNSVIYCQGVFKTAEDFRNVNYLIKSSSSEDFKVYPHRFFNSSTVKVKLGDSTYSFLKSEIYGYQDQNNSYRFYNGQQYTILNPKESILIYSKTILAGPKGNLPTEVYFFSKDESSSIQPLTIENFKSVFRFENEFYDIVNLHFKADDDLLKYDYFRKQYLINYFYQKTKIY